MRIAAAQLAPVYLDREATIAKVVEYIGKSAETGISLLAFPETFVPGYPSWADFSDASHFNAPDQKEAWARYLAESVDVAQGDLEPVVKVVSETGVFTYLGVVERAESGGSVYASLIAISPEDGIVSIHRKLKPTYGERMMWADGDGAGLVVHDWAGARVSGLNCWENWMPLARTALYAQGTQIHIASWPGSPWLTRDISKFIALEGRVFVISSGAVLRAEHIPNDFILKERMLTESDVFSTGGARIVGPDGKLLAEAEKGVETVIHADIEISQVREERQNFDPTGHYSRPDVLHLNVNRARRGSADFIE